MRKLTHNEMLAVRVSSSIVSLLEKKARKHGMSVAELHRQALRREVMETAA